MQGLAEPINMHFTDACNKCLSENEKQAQTFTSITEITLDMPERYNEVFVRLEKRIKPVNYNVVIADNKPLPKFSSKCITSRLCRPSIGETIDVTLKPRIAQAGAGCFHVNHGYGFDIFNTKF
jgi:hypothetical protein